MKRMTDCVWRDKGVCLLKAPDCLGSCDFKTLAFEKDAILQRIVFERRQITKMYFLSKDRKKEQILDKTRGVILLYDVLQKFFGMPNPLKKKVNVLITDDERMKSVMKKKELA